MSKVKSESYIVIQGWMVTELDLKGIELLVYAIIYGFSQDGESKFTGSLQYLADWTNSTRQGVSKALKTLLDKNLIVKEDYEINGIKFCKYYADLVDGVQLSCTGVQLSLTNNINNNINNNKLLSKDNNLESAKQFEFGKPKIEKKSRYQQYLDLINTYTDNLELRTLLKQYLDYLLENCRDKNKQFYPNQLKGLLNNLDNVHKKSEPCVEKYDIVLNSLNRGYLSFYPITSNSFKPKGVNEGFSLVDTNIDGKNHIKSIKEY